MYNTWLAKLDRLQSRVGSHDHFVIDVVRLREIGTCPGIGVDCLSVLILIVTCLPLSVVRVCQYKPINLISR